MAKATATIAPKLIRAIPRSAITIILPGLGMLALYTRHTCLRLWEGDRSRKSKVAIAGGLTATYQAFESADEVDGARATKRP